MAKIIYAQFIPFGPQDLCTRINATGLAHRVIGIVPDTPPPGYHGPVATYVFFQVEDHVTDNLPK